MSLSIDIFEDIVKKSFPVGEKFLVHRNKNYLVAKLILEHISFEINYDGYAYEADFEWNFNEGVLAGFERDYLDIDPFLQKLYSHVKNKEAEKHFAQPEQYWKGLILSWISFITKANEYMSLNINHLISKIAIVQKNHEMINKTQEKLAFQKSLERFWLAKEYENFISLAEEFPDILAKDLLQRRIQIAKRKIAKK